MCIPSANSFSTTYWSYNDAVADVVIVKDYCSASQIERAQQLQQLWDAQVQASVTSAAAQSQQLASNSTE